MLIFYWLYSPFTLGVKTVSVCLGDVVNHKMLKLCPEENPKSKKKKKEKEDC